MSGPDEETAEITNRVADWSRFLKTRYKKELTELLREYPHKRSLVIDYHLVESFGKPGTQMADEILENPGMVIEDLREAIKNQHVVKTKKGEQLPKEINLRFINLPIKICARDIRSEQINKMLSVEGILRKTTEVRPRIVEAIFRCPAGHMTRRMQEYGRFIEPEQCGTEGCTFRKLQLIAKRSRFIDAQKVRIQESPEGLRGGQQPQTLDVDVTDDITGTVAPGDRVVINGILRSQQRVTYGTKSTTFDIYLECNSIEVAEKEFEEVNITEKDEEEIIRLSADPTIYRKIVHSIAPTIYGNEDVKEAIALQLFGGITKEMPDGSRLRGDIHVLLIGDPGIAKSQILRYVVNLSPRGIYTSGQSSTSAGLTATAVKDEFGDGRWTLEAGALVLADMGIAAVDEMDKMQKEDRSALHEAMEQQCYDDQTEILTEKGWKFFKDLGKNERVASLTQDGFLTYEIPSHHVISDYDGQMYYIKSRQVNLAVTPNHNMYVNLNKRANDWEGFKLIRMDELPINKRMRFKKNAKWKGDTVTTHTVPGIIKFGNQNCTGYETEPIIVKMDDWLEFLGYFLSEGSVQKHWETGVPYRVNISQKIPESTEVIRICLEKLPFKYSYDGANFSINSKQLAGHLVEFGKCHEKYVPAYAKQVPPEQIQILLKALVLGDGCTRKTTGQTVYITSSKRLADDVTELLLKIGWSGNIYCQHRAGDKIKDPRGIETRCTHGIWEVSFIRDGVNEPNINTNGEKHIQIRPYSGKIYCVEVPEHLLYVRRDGIPVWCGNTISVAKAGITATLKTRCALLGAANPKLGRFDEYADIGEQINMPPSLLSRFDLIFILTDKPDHKRDEAIADFIIRSHGVGELIAQHSRDPIEGVTDEYITQQLAPVTPDIDAGMLRKYIAYAKRTCFPILSTEAKETLIAYYMKLRDLADSNKPVPVTARQLEALVRLAEASARVRLSKTIESSDAERVVKIVDTCLRQVAYDAKTGTFDIDKVATGISKGKRDLIRMIKDVIRENGDVSGRAQIQQVIDLVAQQGFGKDEVKKQIDIFLRQGEAMEPKNGVIKLI